MLAAQAISQKEETGAVGICYRCGKASLLVSQVLSLCADCIRKDFNNALPLIQKAHHLSRGPFNLPAEIPLSGNGPACHLCANECRPSPGEKGYCGLRANIADRLTGGTVQTGVVHWQYNNLITSCLGDWPCSGGTESGYPRSPTSYRPSYGYKNLAVFYKACSFDCLFCQSWPYRYEATRPGKLSAADLSHAVDERTACISFVGGDPAPQMAHALRTARLAREQHKGRVLRICWETNGSMHPALLEQAARLSLESGGCIKMDIKAWSEELHTALCGVSNRRTLENFRTLARYIPERASPPFLIASTPLVPGYIDREEVGGIAAFIASINPGIPYTLLAFRPRFMMSDMPPTSEQHANECLAEAKAQGLRNVRLGNTHLLGDCY